MRLKITFAWRGVQRKFQWIVECVALSTQLVILRLIYSTNQMHWKSYIHVLLCLFT